MKILEMVAGNFLIKTAEKFINSISRKAKPKTMAYALISNNSDKNIYCFVLNGSIVENNFEIEPGEVRKYYYSLLPARMVFKLEPYVFEQNIFSTLFTEDNIFRECDEAIHYVKWDGKECVESYDFIKRGE